MTEEEAFRWLREACINYNISNIDKILDRTLVDIVDFSGKKTTEKYNIPLFYIYKNGDVDRKLIIQ